MNKNRKKHVLVVGGTSGLGLAIARLLVREGCSEIFATGRHNPLESGVAFLELDIGPDAQKVSADLDDIISQTVSIDLFVYAAGFVEEGTIELLSDLHIAEMVNVSLTAPAILISRILRRQSKLPGVILITSTSQWIPRLKEPVYAAGKAALGMLGDSLALDPRVGKVLVAGPAGMDTKFWHGEKRGGVLLDPKWVAEEILKVWEEGFVYKCVRILRDPPEAKLVEERITR